jgi:WD40 repeat protein
MGEQIMGRLLLTLALGSALAVGIAWYYELWPQSGETDGQGGPASPHRMPSLEQLGPYLYPPAPPAKELAPVFRTPGPDAVEIRDCTLLPVDRQDVSSQREGKLLYVGSPVLQENPNNPGNSLTVPLHVGGKDLIKTYRKIDRDDVVQAGQVVAYLDPTLPLADLLAAMAKKEASEADLQASKATYEEAQNKLERLDNLKRRNSAIVTPEEYNQAALVRDRYRQEVVSKEQAIRLAGAEIEKAQTILQHHEIRNEMHGAGVVKAVFKHKGEAIRAQEPILQLYSLEHLRAEGMADIQYLSRLKPGAPVILEPTILDPPYRVLRGHRGEINDVAICGQGPDLRVVSVSEDTRANVWSLAYAGGPVRVLYHPAPVRTVACTPRAWGRNWCLTGDLNGSLRLWDLDGKDDGPRREIKDSKHRGPITALAFSPDGRYFATGGDDNLIQVWETDGSRDEALYAFDVEHGVDRPHQGTITSLSFTPQARLVSASRDNSVRVWTLHKKGAVMEPRIVTGRQGTVAHLGVTADGGRMLVDQGRRLQVLTVPEGRILCDLQSSFGLTPFETLALFSPDAEGSLLMTAGAPEGRLQLWRSPAPGRRAFEVRQLAPPGVSPVTCAAFAPDAGSAADGSFAVSGTKDGNVYLWQLPTREALAQHRIEGLTLSLVDRALDANTRQVHIGVNVINPIDAQHPYGRLMPGRPVTVVVGEP